MLCVEGQLHYFDIIMYYNMIKYTNQIFHHIILIYI